MFYLFSIIHFYPRDTLIYATSVETKGLDKAVEIMGEVVLRPLITEEEVLQYFNKLLFT